MRLKTTKKSSNQSSSTSLHSRLKNSQKYYNIIAGTLAATAAVSLTVAAAKMAKSKGGASKALEEFIQSRAKNIASERIDPLRDQAKKLWPAGIHLDGSKGMENNFTKLTGAQVRAQRQRSFKLGDKKPNGITKKTFNEYRGDKRRKELHDTLASLAKERERDERRANNVKEYLEQQKKLGLINDEILEKIKKRGEEIVGHKL